MTQTEEPSENTFRILISTDNHIGYMERDPVRGQDSFRTFDEILQIGRDQKCDFVLLAGDLFHHNNPSVGTLHRLFEILRTYTMPDNHSDCDQEVSFQLLSDATVNFNDKFSIANWMNRQMNFVMPVFTIHGNHDDQGQANFSAIDIFSIAGYVNYIGKQNDYDNVEINPVILQKGTSILDIYALGNIRDERLHRAFKSRKVKLTKPLHSDEHFSLMMLHQNRVKRGECNYIPEEFLDNSMDLVFWGHEHDCRIDPQYNAQQEFHVTQPGSSVATSLSDGEAVPKHVGILEITGRDFTITPIPLRTVRPFIMGDVSLSDSGVNVCDTSGIQKFIQRQIEDMIVQVMENWRLKHPGEQQEPLPLVRLKIDYSGDYSSFNPARFGMLFINKVANPKDIVMFYKKIKKPTTRRLQVDIPSLDEMAENAGGMKQVHIEDIIAEYLQTQNLNLLSEKGMTQAIFQYITKGDNAIDKFVSKSTIKAYEKLINNEDVQDVDDVTTKLKEIKMQQKLEDPENQTADTKSKSLSVDVLQSAADSETSDSNIKPQSKPQQSKKTARSPRKASSEVEEVFIDGSAEEDEPAPKKRKSVAKKAVTANKAPSTKKSAAPKKSTWPPKR